MEDSDAQDLRSRSLDVQFQFIKEKTTQSHVMRYGSLEFAAEPIGNFQGNHDDPFVTPSIAERFFKRAKLQASLNPQDIRKSISTVSSRDAKLHHLYAHLQEKGGHRVHLDMTTEITDRMRIDHVFEDFLPMHLRASERVLPTNFECLRGLMDTYENTCGPLGDYGLKYVKYFV